MILRASSAKRIAMCPGSAKAEHGLTDYRTKEYDEMSKSGKKLHLWLECWIKRLQTFTDIELPELTYEEEQRVDIIRYRLQKIIDEHGEIVESYTEQSLFLKDYDTQMDIWSGHPDLYFKCSDGTWHLVDYKTLWGEHDDAYVNMQLRAYVVMVVQVLKIDCIHAHLLTPRQTTSVIYYQEDVLKAYLELNHVALDAETKDVRNPGEWCQYCKAVGNPERCPESCKSLSTVAETQVSTLEQAVKIYELRKMINAALKKSEEMIRNAIEQGVDCGYELDDGKKQRKITDVQAVYRLMKQYVHESELAGCMSFSIPSLEKAIKDLNENMTGKEVKEFIASELGKYIDESRTKGSLKKVAA